MTNILAIIGPQPYNIIAYDDEAEWLEKRQDGIGTSDAAVVVGDSPYKTPYTLWAEKTRQIKPADLSENEKVFWGNRLEHIIVETFGDRTGRTTHLSGQLLRSIPHPWAQCTLDAWTHIDDDVVPLEVKNVGLRQESNWESGPPITYMWQCQHQLLVTGCDKMSIAALVGGQQLIWCDVERDEIMINKLIYAGDQFWQRVEAMSAPTPGPGDKNTLKNMYPDDDGSVVNLPGDLEEIDSMLVDLKKEKNIFIKDIDKRIAHCETLIMDALGKAKFGVLPSGAGYKWETSNRKGYTVDPKTKRQLRRIKPKK